LNEGKVKTINPATESAYPMEFQTLVGDSAIAESLIDSDINAVTFTGSVPVGAKVAQRATSQIKKTVLELGGSDPF
jgi:acyl-CoA reductase-like NAD-dependent aldehyde dehydrogenase